MPIPNGGLITETNQQYYEGAQDFLSNGAASQEFTTTFNTDLIFGNWNPSTVNYALNNFKVYTSATGLPNPGSWNEYLTAFTVNGNVITLTGLPINT